MSPLPPSAVNGSGKTGWQRLRQKLYDILLHENWMIGIIDQPIANAIQWTECPPVRWIGSRSGRRYLADPFAWPGQAGVIYVEEFDFASGMGRLLRLEVEDTVIKRETPLNLLLPGHLSFPFLFASGNNVYLMPESGAARQLALFEWQASIKTWREYATPLSDTAAADAVLFERDGLFWIAYIDTDINNFDNLNLCYAPALGGPWKKHPKNPVKRDIRTSRGAGAVFEVEGKLYRPAQDCAECYGGSIRIMEIVTCTQTAYEEREVAHLRPGKGKNPHGLHTLAPYGDKCLIDGKRMMFSPAMVLGKVLRRLSRLWN